MELTFSIFMVSATLDLVNVKLRQHNNQYLLTFQKRLALLSTELFEKLLTRMTQLVT